MKKVVYCIITFLTVLLCGCQSEMNEVNKDNMLLEQSQQDSLETSVNKEKILSVYHQALNHNYVNFKVPFNITVDFKNIYSQIDLIQESNFETNAEAVFQMFFQELVPQNAEITLESNDFHNYKQLVDETNKLYGVARDDGFVSIVKPVGWEIQFRKDFMVEDIIHVDRGEPLNNSYQLYDGLQSLQDAVDYVNDWLNQNWVMWEPDFEYRVKTVEVRNIKDGYFYDMVIEKVYEGIPLEDILNSSVYTIDEHNNLLLEYTMSPIMIRMYQCNSIDVFSNAPGIIKIKHKSEEQEGWLPLLECMLSVEELFSEYVVYDISDIEIKYVICPDYESIKSQRTKIDFHSPGLEMKAKPVWSLIIDIDKEKLLNEDGTFTEGNVRHYINIDMRTGEVWFELE